jgi:hypothetical protein
MVRRFGHSASARTLSHLFVMALPVLLRSGLAHAASAFIRVNQVGYIGSASKRAYLMSTAAETGGGRARPLFPGTRENHHD